MLLLSERSWNRTALAALASSGKFGAGSYTCTGKGTLTFSTASTMPAYSSANVIDYWPGTPPAGILGLLFSDSGPENLRLQSPTIASLGGTVAAGLAYRFDFLVTRLTPGFYITLDGTSVFNSSNNTSGVFALDANNQFGTHYVALPSANMAALTDSLNYNQVALLPMVVTIYVRRYNGTTNKAEIETWVEYAGLSRVPLCIDRQTGVSVTNGQFLFNIGDTNGGMGAANVTGITSIEIADSGDLDPTNQLGWLTTISESELYDTRPAQCGIPANGGYAHSVTQNLELVLAADIFGDGWTAVNRLQISSDSGRTWTETYLAGNDQWGNATSSTALFDNDFPNNVIAAIGLTRTALNTTTVTYGYNTTDVSHQGPLAANQGMAVPFTVTGTFTSSVPVGVKLNTGNTTTLRACICTYDAANSSGGYVGKLVSSIGTLNATSGQTGWVTIDVGSYTLNAGQYMLCVWSESNTWDIVLGGNAPGTYLSSCDHTKFSAGADYSGSGNGGWSAVFGLGAIRLYQVSVPGYATATVTFATNTSYGAAIVLNDSAGTSNQSFTASTVGGLVDAINSWSASNGSYWTATALPNPWTSAPRSIPGVNIQPTQTGYPVNCNGVAAGGGYSGSVSQGTIYSTTCSGNCALGWDSATGNVLAVTQRTAEGNTTWLVGKVGVYPYGAANWSSEFLIRGGQMAGPSIVITGNTSGATTYIAGTYVPTGLTVNSYPQYSCAAKGTLLAVDNDGYWAIHLSTYNRYQGPLAGPNILPAGLYTYNTDNGTAAVTYTAQSGGDQLDPGDVRKVIRLTSGQWAIAFDWSNARNSTSGTSVIVSNAGWSDTQLQSSVPVGTSGSGWTESVISSDGGYETNICQLSNGKILAAIRWTSVARLSLGTLSGNTITWADPTGGTGTYCYCDGGVNTSPNTHQRPYFWSGDTPVCVASDPVNKLVYFISANLPGSDYHLARGITQVYVASETEILSGSFRLHNSKYGTLISSAGNKGYHNFHVVNGELRGLVGPNYFSGFPLQAVSSGGGILHIGF